MNLRELNVKIPIDKLAKVTRIFGPDDQPTFHVKNEPLRTTGIAPKRFYRNPIDWEEIAEHYDMPDNPWHEKIIAMSDPQVLAVPSPFIIIEIATSLDVIALRKMALSMDVFSPINYSSIVVTNDDKILFGRRGDKGIILAEGQKNAGLGLWHPLASDSMKFQPDYGNNPVIDTAREKLRQELGEYPIDEPIIIGACNTFTRGQIGTSFVVVTRIHATSDAIIAFHDVADTFYESRRSTVGYPESVEHLIREGYPHDIWHHNSLCAISNEEDPIRQFLTYNQECELTGMGTGALLTYLRWLTNK